MNANELDRFGGWTGRRFDATGFFRLEKDERWWLVTPEGNAFLSLGINHYHAHCWQQDYNREHWMREFGAAKAGDADWVRGWGQRIKSDLAHLGLNTLGIHTNIPRPLRASDIAPYVARFEPVDIPHYKEPGPDKFVDVFAPEFDAHCDEVARGQVAPLADDPMVLGFSMTDCPIFTDLDAAERGMTIYGAPRPELPTWPRVLRNLGADAPGKRAYVLSMRSASKGQLRHFNETYGTDFASWDALASATDWRPRTDYGNEREFLDNTWFLRECIQTYYRKAKAALRRYDTNHLFFGDKLNGNIDMLNYVLPATCYYTDLVFYQMYARYDEQREFLNRWSDFADKSFLNGDSTFSCVTEDMPSPYGPHAKDQTQRAEWTREFAESAFARPDFVGWHICGTVDTHKVMDRKADKQHSGLMTATGEFYPEMERTICDLSARLYDIGIGV